jgi:hypothetical protein
LVAVSTLNSAPARSLACSDVTYRVTVIGPTGGEASAIHCSIGALAGWLHLYPETTISPSSPPGSLGSLYVVRFEDVSTPENRLLLQLRLYPSASEGPIVDLIESGFIQTQTFTGSVTPGWRILDPTIPVPPSLTSLGVPQADPFAGPVGGRPSSTSSRGGPDAVSLAFLTAIAGATAVVIVRRRVRKPTTV